MGTAPSIARSRKKKETGHVERQDKRNKGAPKGGNKEESTESGRRKAAGSGHQRNKAEEMRTEQDGRNRWKEREKTHIAWDT